MTSFATINGIPVVSGELIVPLVGPWTADVALSTDQMQSGPATIVIGNLSLVGTIIRAQAFAGQTKCRVVAGYGGWRKPIPQQGYSYPSGVMLSMVLGDAAMACGEKVNVPNDASIGAFYARPADEAGVSLRFFCPAWYVDVNGVTQIASWPSTTVGSQFQVIDQDPAAGVTTIATEDYASWLPGASFSADTVSGSPTVNGVVYHFNNDGTFRLEVLSDANAATDRILGPLHAIIDRRVATTKFLGRYRYTISNPTLSTVDAEPMDQSIGLPSLQSVPLDSDSIATYTPPSGGECHIMFLDGSPTMPRVVWTAGTATVCNVLGGANPVARQGDQTNSYLPPTLTLTCSGTLGGTPFVGTAVTVIPNPISGSIVQGSPTVNAP